MCGLFGALSFDGNAINSEHAERMSERVARRGPDDKGEFFDGPVMLGHRRLSIIDLSPAGHQPMQDSSGRYAIVFNGTIYNYPELREILIGKGYRFNSHSDTEVIINALLGRRLCRAPARHVCLCYLGLAAAKPVPGA
jgi:asparagine synthase (glutamine-hydrolysing)